MCFVFALKIDTFANEFLMVIIKPGREVYREALHLQVKRPSAITDACPKPFGLTILQHGLVFIGT